MLPRLEDGMRHKAHFINLCKLQLQFFSLSLSEVISISSHYIKKKSTPLLMVSKALYDMSLNSIPFAQGPSTAGPLSIPQNSRFLPFCIGSALILSCYFPRSLQSRLLLTIQVSYSGLFRSHIKCLALSCPLRKPLPHVAISM